MAAAHQASNLAANPFTPVFGKVPPYLAGRGKLIQDILDTFEHPDNNPNRCTLFVGARGTGKTALLTYLADEAQHMGWVTANVTASRTILDDIWQQSVAASAHLLPASPRRTLTGIGIGSVGSLSWETHAPVPGNWRSRMSSLIDQLNEHACGLLITVDEIDPSLDGMTELVTTYQHFVREDRRVILLMAGLPHHVSNLLSGKSTSFIRRAARHDLGSIPAYEAREAFRLTTEQGGKTIDDEALSAAIEAIDGFPFMFQLVGYRSWNATGNRTTIELEDVVRGSAVAQEELVSRVLDATISELSPADIRFLKAMARDDGLTRQADLKERLGKPSSHVSTYKKRLLEAGAIEETRRGVLRFALPGLREYLRTQHFSS